MICGHNWNIFSIFNVSFSFSGDNKFFYDGTVTCYKGLHLVMTIVAVVVLVFFVILPPLAVLLMCYGVINIPLQVIDAFTKGLRYFKHIFSTLFSF